jgi:mannose-1-phosphate guanylyltransferase
MYKNNKHVWGIVLAGGEGRRLQSFIYSQYGTKAPKQYCAFTGTRSMLRHTIDRTEMFIQPERLLTIVNKRHLSYAKNQLDDRPSGTVIVQPHERQTGPGILYPLLHVYQRDPEAIACLFPSDHFILNEQNFMKHIEFSSRFVAENPQSFLLLGVNPKQPEGEYGWIVTGEQIIDNGAKRIYLVARFAEKPDAVTATQLYNKGSLWNTMVVVGKVRKLLTLFKTYTPIVYQAFWEIRDVLGSSLEAQVVEDMYTRLAPMNFSYSILEKNPAGLRAVKVQGAYWNDWGNAARIQSDIQCFCTAKGTSAVLLPFEKMFDSTDSVQKSQGGA